jgi:hypothetical protein
MAMTGIIGLSRQELECVQTLLRILRHPDPVVAELARQALAYLAVPESSPGSTVMKQASLYQ